VFNSGMAAIMTAVMTFARAGSIIVYTTPLYGGTQSFIHQMLEPWGVRGIPVPAGQTRRLSDAIRDATDLPIVLVETPANPTMTMTDIRSVVAAAQARSGQPPLIMVDNTFLGPAFQHPLS